MKKRYLGLLALAAILTSGLAVVNEHGFDKVDAAGETETVTMTNFTVTSANMDNVVSYSCAKGGGTSDPAANSGQIRIYQKNGGGDGGEITVTAKENYTLTSVTIGSAMATTVSYKIGDSVTANNSISAGGKLTVSDINNGSITFVCNGTDKNSRLYVNYLSASYVSLGSTEPEYLDYNTEVKPLFIKYYNESVYTKETVINLSDKAKEDLATYFHAGVSKLERTTYYNDGALWMENGSGYSYYGTDETNKHMTSGKVATLEETSNTVAVKNQTMEQYYATLHDFTEGTHNSIHSNNQPLDLTTNWTLDTNGVYTSTSADVIDAFRLFTAPLWIGKDTSNENILTFTKATVEEKNNNLIMKLYVSGTNDGFIKGSDNNEYTDEVFSQATITKGIVEEQPEEPQTIEVKHNSSTTINLTDTVNNASYFGLDESLWTVTANKGEASNNIGLNSGGDFRLYYKNGGSGNELTFTYSGSLDIEKISLTFTSSSYDDVTVKAGSETVSSDANGNYLISGKSFTLANYGTAQVRIKTVTIDIA